MVAPRQPRAEEATMADVRRIKKVWKAKPTVEGAGVRLKRVFGNHEVPQLDPFLLLDDFRSNDPAEYVRGFPWHPHRGIETITYVLAGDVEHGDSRGNRGVISSGDVQWMTAGSGIIHQEMPKGDREGRMWGFQLWANLPARHKMMDPRYREVKRDDIPEATTAEGATVRVVCGEVAGVRGPVREIVTEPEYLDVSIPARSTFRHPVKAGHTVFASVFAVTVASASMGRSSSTSGDRGPALGGPARAPLDRLASPSLGWVEPLPLPRWTAMGARVGASPRRGSLPPVRVGVHNCPFEACS